MGRQLFFDVFFCFVFFWGGGGGGGGYCNSELDKLEI